MVRRVLAGQTPKAVATAFGVCVKTVRKWVSRFRAEGVDGLPDRSSRPHRLRRPTPQPVTERIETLRRQRWTGEQIAQEVGVSPATVSRVLNRLGLSRMRDLEPAVPVRRYERQEPGEMIHLDIKKLGRFERVGHRITGDRTGQSNNRGVGGSSFTPALSEAEGSPSTTPRASPSPRSCPMRGKGVPRPSFSPRCATIEDSASPSPAS